MQATLERTLWFSALLMLGLAALLAMAMVGVGGRLPDLPVQADRRSVPVPFPNTPYPDLFATSAVPALAVATNVINPYFTLYFQPPPPPPTKKVPLHYVGCVESSTGILRAYVRVGETLAILPLGEKVIADHAIKEITLKALVLTNVAGQTNVFEFNTTKPLEVPAN